MGKGRALIHPHRRQLGAVPDKHQSAVHAGADKTDEVIQQIAGAEKRGLALPLGINPYERSLIHHEKGILRFVGTEGETAEAVTPDRFLAIYAFMYGLGGAPGKRAEHFGGPSRRGEKHGIDSVVFQGFDYSSNSGSLAGTGISVDHQDVGIISGKEFPHGVEKPGLARCRIESEPTQKSLLEESCPIHSVRSCFLL